MGSLVASIDPGKHSAGVAVFYNEQLQLAKYVERKGEHLAKHVRTAIGHGRAVAGKQFGPLELVIEIPQIYQRAYQKGDQNDLIWVAFEAGRMLQAIEPTRYVTVLPREWKGQTPKDVMCRRIESKLGPLELERVKLPKAKSLHHNVWDAVGIGLKYLGRL